MEKPVQKIELTGTEYRVGKIQRYFIYGYFFLAFFEPYLNGTLGAFTKYYILFLMSILCWSYKKLRIRLFHWCFLGWLIFKIISSIWTPNSYIPELHLFSQIGMIALLIVLTSIPLDNKTINSIINTMWLGSAVIGVLSLFFSHPYHGTVSTRQVLYLFGQEADPNNQAAFLLIGVTIALYNLVTLRRYLLMSAVTIVVNAFSLFMTGSRGGLVGFICIGLIFLLTAPQRKGIRSKVKLILIMVFFGGVLYYLASTFLPDDIFARLFTFSSYEGGSERDVIWANGWKLFSSDLNCFFGAGWGAYYGFNGIYQAMHNTFLAMLCDVGIIGFIIFFTPIMWACVKLIKRGNLLPFLLIICGFILSFFIEAINKRFFWNVIFLLFIVYVNCLSGRAEVKNGN